MMKKTNGNEKMFGEELIGLDKVKSEIEEVLSHISKQRTEEFYEDVKYLTQYLKLQMRS